MNYEVITLCIVAMVAGFIDSIAGGGGLIQTPAALITLGRFDVVTILGTIKIPSFTGTASAAIQYTRKVALHKKLLLIMCSVALLAAYIGSVTLSFISNSFIKPVIFCVLIVVAFYTYTKKDFGTAKVKDHSTKHELIYAIVMALIIGFYDGFIGPGAGSFLIIFFISILGFDFLKASAHAKFVNLATNMGSIIFFAGKGHILYQYALPMAACNLTGAVFGARLAILKGNKFIRIFFLVVVVATILRYGYDIFIR